MVNNCVPLMLTNQYGNKYPNIWEEIEKLHIMQKERPIEQRRSNDTSSDLIKLFNSKYERVAEFEKWGKSSETIKYLVDPNVVHLSEFLYTWRIHKQIYRFPKEMEEVLCSQNDGMDTPIKIFENLPYDCLYIETNNISYNEKAVLGFFVKRTDATTNLNGSMAYEICLVFEDLSVSSVTIRYDEDIKNDTGIFDALMNTMLKEMKLVNTKTGELLSYEDEEVLEYAKNAMLDVYNNSFYSILPQVIQLILYICAENKEVEENPEQKKITRKPKDKKFIKDKYREVQIWDCGNKISEKIRTFLVSNKHNNDVLSQRNTVGIGKSKAPHSRRGHWHHFWTGKIGSEARKLILRWVAPTFVNGTPNTVNINIVETEQ